MRNIVVNASLVIVVCLVMAVGLEVGASWYLTLPTVPEDHPFRHLIADPTLGWREEPSVTFTINEQWTVPEYPFDYPIEINALGWHDQETPLAKPAGVERLLLIGDSFVECFQAPHELCAQAWIERDTGMQVIPAGVAGWGTDQELAFYQTEGASYTPDRVLLVLYIGNDIANNWAPLDSNRGPWPNYILGKSTTPPALALAHFIHYLMLPSPPTFASGFGVFAEPILPAWLPAFGETERLLREFARSVADDGIPFGVVIIPSSYQLAAETLPETAYPVDVLAPTAWLKGIFDQAGINYLDLLPFLTRAEYIQDGGHLTADGQRIMGQAIAAWIVSVN